MNTDDTFEQRLHRRVPRVVAARDFHADHAGTRSDDRPPLGRHQTALGMRRIVDDQRNRRGLRRHHLEEIARISGMLGGNQSGSVT